MRREDEVTTEFRSGVCWSMQSVCWGRYSKKRLEAQKNSSQRISTSCEMGFRLITWIFHLLCFFCLFVLVSQVKVCTATWWFIVIFVFYFLKHDFLVKRHVFHRFYSSKCQCNCISVILTSPYSCC